MASMTPTHGPSLGTHCLLPLVAGRHRVHSLCTVTRANPNSRATVVDCVPPPIPLAEPARRFSTRNIPPVSHQLSASAALHENQNPATRRRAPLTRRTVAYFYSGAHMLRGGVVISRLSPCGGIFRDVAVATRDPLASSVNFARGEYLSCRSKVKRTDSCAGRFHGLDNARLHRHHVRTGDKPHHRMEPGTRSS